MRRERAASCRRRAGAPCPWPRPAALPTARAPCLPTAGAPIASSEHPHELFDPPARARGITSAPEEAREQLLREERVLEPLHRPLQDRGHELGLDVAAQLAAGQALPHEGHGPVGVLAGEVAVDLQAQGEVAAVVPDEGEPPGDVVLVDEVLAPLQPIPEGGEEALRAHRRGRVLVARQRLHRALVGGQEEALLAAEVLEDRALGDPQLGRHVLDAGGLVPGLREAPHGGGEDALAFLAGRAGRA